MSDSFWSSDIISLTLTAVPDFKTLLSLITTTKTFYQTFQTHPHSIVCSVAYNEVGDALPQALRLVRCDYRRFHGVDVSNLPEEIDITKTPIRHEEARMLTKNARTAHALECFYSWRCKDRTSKTSQLSRAESVKFQRALYRIWLYSVLYRFPVEDEDSPEDEDDEDEDFEEALRTKKQNFLMSFTGSDLDEMERMSGFLLDIARWVINAEATHTVPYSQSCEYLLWNGPQIILQCYQDVTMFPYAGQDHATFLSDHLEVIRKDRGQDPRSSISEDKVILSEILGDNDACQRCGVREGLQLWNEANWDYLPGVLNRDIHQRLPGKLVHNPTETSPLKDTLRNLDYSVLMTQLFNGKEAPYDQLSGQDLLCLNCLNEFIQHHLCQWWLNHKREAGEDIPEDCWYGWNCRTMIHKPYHAKRLNHLCMPQRGDP